MINPINNNFPSASINLDMDPSRILPKEISLFIFSYFSPEELGKSCLVSRQWNQLASTSSLWNALDIRSLFPKVKVFDESDWKAHIDLSSLGLSVDDAPPSDKRKDIPVLKSLLPTLSVEGNAGVTLLTIPKGLTFNKLVQLAASSKQGNVTKFKHILHRISEELGDVAVDKTYRIVITNNILNGSRDISVSDQKALVSKIGCEMPKVLEATMLLVVTYMRAGERLYNDAPSTYTRCREQVAGRQTVIGGFGPVGLYVFSNQFDGDIYGVGALREF